ncbi:MAG: LPS export ABC transporter periplasmic protein LptC [Candidatus Marinimicrobia bacterium]|nr:LPS export ABC transporter periplasmic protein LptC [Candidatus Neomarinimicrobiota bacterium]
MSRPGRIHYAWLALLLLSGCGDSGLSRQVGKSKDMYPDQESWVSNILISRDGLLVARAVSDRMVKYDAQNLAHLLGNVRIDFFNAQGGHVSRLYSDSADVNMLNNNLLAFGNVTIQSDSGLVLSTTRLSWSHEYNMIETDDSVMFATPQLDTLYGVGFESDVDLTHWKIYQPSGVTGRGLVNEF